MHDYRIWRRNEGGLCRVSEKTQMDTLRVFIRFCARMDIVEKDLHTAVVSPTLTDDDRQSGDIVEPETAEQILAVAAKYHYASRPHALFLLAWRTAARLSGLRAIDLEDYYSDEEYLKIKNRPETGTRLKNGRGGERLVALHPSTCTILDEYIDHNRVDSVDEYSRNPLFTTTGGRMSNSAIRNTAYRMTSPCKYDDSCPHDRDPEECDAANRVNEAYECPSSTAPHSIRRGAITNMRRREIPREVVSDRADVSEPVLEKHYDKRSPRERMELRRSFLENI
jgi:integrase